MKGGTRKQSLTWSYYFDMGIKVIDRKLSSKKRRVFVSSSDRGRF